MIYNEDDLFNLIRPIIATAVETDADPDLRIDATTNAIVEIIKQDRQANA